MGTQSSEFTILSLYSATYLFKHLPSLHRACSDRALLWALINHMIRLDNCKFVSAIATHPTWGDRSLKLTVMRKLPKFFFSCYRILPTFITQWFLTMCTFLLWFCQWRCSLNRSIIFLTSTTVTNKHSSPQRLHSNMYPSPLTTMHLRLWFPPMLVEMLWIMREMAPRTKMAAPWLGKMVVTGFRLGHSFLYPTKEEPKL